LARLKEADPEAAELLRGMQRKMSQSINESKRLQERLERLENLAEGEEESDESPALPPGITDDNVRLFKQIADYLGYVPREEVEQRTADLKSTDFVQSELRRGMELYGDSFAYEDEDGNVRVNPEVSGRLERVLKRLQDPHGGVTPLDLYVLDKYSGGRSRSTSRTGESGTRRSGGVIRRTSGRGERLKIYDERRGDSADDVLDRAWVLGKRRLMNL